MHNGMFKTLAEVVAYYNTPEVFVKHAYNTDTLIKPLHLDENAQADIIEFLHTLTDKQFLK
jgi:cytochrome c peroxidase